MFNNNNYQRVQQGSKQQPGADSANVCKNYTLRQSVAAVDRVLTYLPEYLGNFQKYVDKVSQQGDQEEGGVHILGRQPVRVAVSSEQAAQYTEEMKAQFNKLKALNREFLGEHLVQKEEIEGPSLPSAALAG